MKALLIIAASLAVALPAAAQTTIYSGPNGAPLGTSTTIGSTTIYSGPAGQPMGTSNQIGNQTIYSGPAGQPMGSSTTLGPAPRTRY